MSDILQRDQLLDLYRIALDEYRFEVRLGWDRTTYFVVLNSAILTVATGLLKLDNPPVVYGFIALLFLFGCGTALVGSMSITKAHEYYRRTVVKKTLIENYLGLTNPLPDRHPSLDLATGTTNGQSDHLRILSDPEAWVARRHRRTAITFWLRWILRAMAIVDLAGSASAGFMLVESLKPILPMIH